MAPNSNALHTGIVSIHVRRGDYVGLKQFHPFCGKKYYDRCIEYFRTMGNYIFMVCSDDIGWCRQNIKGKDIYFSENDVLTDLAIMHKCDHNIIANSSLSWWGAWLNRNPNKLVLYPSIWFGQKCPQDVWDLIPTEWEEIKV